MTTPDARQQVQPDAADRPVSGEETAVTDDRPAADPLAGAQALPTDGVAPGHPDAETAPPQRPTPASGTPRRHAAVLLGGAFVLGAVVFAGVAALLASIATHKAEEQAALVRVVDVADGETDAAVWGQNFPLEYSRFVLTRDDTVRTAYGGSERYSKLARYPAMQRLWAGYAFAVEFNEERSHWYTLIDQKETKRQEVVKQPGACANCHSGDAPNLIRSMGWEAFNKGPYKAISDQLHTAVTCNDCHDPKTMALRITRPAFSEAMAKRGIDLAKASRQDMRTYVCAQCHVEYYFQGENKLLTFPWEKGLSIDAIDAYYEEEGFKDWEHKDTGAPMIKIQHPEFELYSSGVHASSGVACADCHMPYVREGAVKISDHWIRSPLGNIAASCQTCHKLDEAELAARVATIQDRTAGQLRETETAIIAAIDAITAARAAGATDAELAQARGYQRKANLRWDFVSSENSTGFHSPQEAARVLGDAMNFARLAQVSAERAIAGRGAPLPSGPLTTLDPAAVIGESAPPRLP